MNAEIKCFHHFHAQFHYCSAVSSEPQFGATEPAFFCIYRASQYSTSSTGIQHILQVIHQIRTRRQSITLQPFQSIDNCLARTSRGNEHNPGSKVFFNPS